MNSSIKRTGFTAAVVIFTLVAGGTFLVIAAQTLGKLLGAG